eukprot:SAG25_NODE_1082_length_4091_cov_2.364729_2_plen_95_part_00
MHLAVTVERAHAGLVWLWEWAQGQIQGSGGGCLPVAVVVAHAGIFNLMLSGRHPLIVADEAMRSRFQNCELRRALLRAEWVDDLQRHKFHITRE